MLPDEAKRPHAEADGGEGDPAAKRAKHTVQPHCDDMPAEYVFSNGLRRVRPYYYTFRTWTKGRWLRRQLSEVMCDEFMRLSPSYVHKAVRLGRVTVNGATVPVDYVLKDNDRIAHTIHRHERPVQHAPLSIVHDGPDLFVVDKPSSWPTHPCGSYHNNSTKVIAEREHGYKNLRVLYRLDRNTSGLLMFAKTLKKDQEMKELIRTRAIDKVYLAKVRGVFPDKRIVCEQPLAKLVNNIGLNVVKPEEQGGKAAETHFERLCTDGRYSIVSCMPKTGRTHQIRIHLQWLGHPIDDDYLYTGDVWGPMCGKEGDFGGRSFEQLADELIERHSEMHWVIDESGDARQEPQVDLHVPDDQAELAELQESGDGAFDPLCSECRLRKKDPDMRHLSMHLHCWKYSTASWSFETELPQWGKDIGLEERNGDSTLNRSAASV